MHRRKRTAVANPTQAFPARETRIDSFTSLPITFDGTTVPFDQCGPGFINVLSDGLINLRPRRFIVFDPPQSNSLLVWGSVLSTAATSGPRGYTVTMELLIQTKSVFGDFLTAERGWVKSAPIRNPPTQPWPLFEVLRSSITKAVRNIISKTVANPSLNLAPWRSNVIAIEGNDIVIGGGSFDNLKVHNLLDIYRPITEDVARFVATVQVTSVGPRAVGCHYYGMPQNPASPGDIAMIHYLEASAPPRRNAVYSMSGIGIRHDMSS